MRTRSPFIISPSKYVDFDPSLPVSFTVYALDSTNDGNLISGADIAVIKIATASSRTNFVNEDIFESVTGMDPDEYYSIIVTDSVEPVYSASTDSTGKIVFDGESTSSTSGRYMVTIGASGYTNPDPLYAMIDVFYKSSDPTMVFSNGAAPSSDWEINSSLNADGSLALIANCASSTSLPLP